MNLISCTVDLAPSAELAQALAAAGINGNCDSATVQMSMTPSEWAPVLERMLRAELALWTPSSWGQCCDLVDMVFTDAARAGYGYYLSGRDHLTQVGVTFPPDAGMFLIALPQALYDTLLA